MGRLALSMALGLYDRTWPLLDGTVEPEGVDLAVVPIHIREIFYRQLHHQPEFDVSELSLSGYLITLERTPAPYVAIPVFPSRTFRHSWIYVNADRIHEPKDFQGKRVGMPEYSMTAAVWVRGMLQDDHGVDLKSIQWIRGGEAGYTGDERVELALPPGFRVDSAPPGKTLSGMLEAGELDAVISPIPPASVATGGSKVRRLFPDWEPVERDYYRRLGIFPVMHTVAIRREVYERHPWVATSLFKAFLRAKALCYRWLTESTMPYSMPWFVPHLLEQWRFFGCDPYAYGVEPNRKMLEAVTRYSVEQGLTHRRLAVEELFAPEMYDLYAYGPAQLGGLEEIPPPLARALSQAKGDR